jgi:hypothetical protein
VAALPAAAGLAAWVHAHLASQPVGALVRRLARWPVPVPNALAPGPALAACRRVPGLGKGRCLRRSLVGIGLLTSTPVEADLSLCIGIRRRTWRAAGQPPAHAWIEVGGDPVRDPSDPQATCRPLVRFEA